MLLVIMAAIVVRFVRLDKVPASLYYDEIDLGYQMRSLITTGKDYRGGLSPFFFRSFNTDKTPLPIIFSILPSLLFKSPEYQVRAGAALAGVICVMLAMILAYQLTRKKVVGLITGLVFAFSPWLIQFSRIGFEAIFMLMVFLATLVSFLQWQKTKRIWDFYLSAILLGLNIYTYRTMSLMVPVMTGLILLIYFKDFWKMGMVKLAVWLLILAGLTGPFLYSTTIGSADQTRIGQISIFSDPKIPIKVIRSREIDSNDFGNPEIGKKAVWWSRIFHNKGVSYVTAFGENYYRNFSADFLFLSGDPNNRHSPNNTGVLLFCDLVGLIIGLAWVIKNIKDKKYQLLLGLLLLSPIPSDITIDGANHASRLMTMAGPLLLIVGLGYSTLVLWLARSKKYRWGIFLLVVGWLVAVIFNLQNYFVHYPIESARQFGYGFKQAIVKIKSLSNQYKFVRLSSLYESPMLYYFFWSKTPPIELQTYGTEFGDEILKKQPLDAVKPLSRKDKMCKMEEILNLRPDSIYMASFIDLPLDFRGADKDKVPAGIKLIDIIKYPDNEVAYYLITRDTANGKPVLPDETSACK